MKLKPICLLAIGILAINSTFADPPTEETIRELMELTGAGNLGVQVVQQMLPALKNMAPRVPDSFWTEFMKEVNPEELVNLTIPVYQKHYTEEDLRAAVDFYKSPSGRRLIAKQAVVMQESMLAGQQWGQQIARRAFDEIKALEAEKKRD